MLGNIGAALQTLIGGNISLFAQLCERARGDAFHLMLQHVARPWRERGDRDALRRHDIAQGGTEVLACGTAVVVEPVQ